MSNELLPPDGVTLKSAGETLLAQIDVREGPTCEADRTYFDTFDGLLRAAGASVVHQDGRLALVERDSGTERVWVASALPAEPLPPSSLDPGPMRDALVELIEVRALLPLVHVHSRTHALDVLDGKHKTVVRMTLEEPALVASTSVHVELRPRLRLTAVRGYADELERVRSRLERELGFKVADQPLVDEAVRAGGGVPGGVSSKIEVPLEFEQRADRAAVAVLARLLDVMRANVEGTIADIDSEFLHDFRVSVRRSRAVQRELKRVFPPAALAEFRSEFKWLQQATGDARDLDVYVLEFDQYRELVPEGMRRELDPLLGVLASRRLIARREMARALRSERAGTLLLDWRSFLDRLPGLPEEDRPDARRPIGEVSGRRIAKVYKQMLSMGDAIDAASPAADYHELRKKGKELRYLLELFGSPLYPGEVVKPMIKALKALQDVLGRHQDREVQVGVLRSLRDEVSGLPGGPAALMAMGVLVERLLEDEQAAGDEFAERFAAFASKSERKLVKETFA